MTGTHHCPRCGAPRERDRSACPACLMELALDLATEGDAAAVPSTPASRADLPEGSPVGPYVVERKLGEGGMGVVYLAEQAAPVRRKVALKVIKLGLDTGSVLSRFEAEQQALARMDHEGIARLYEAGTTPDGRPYFAMEYVDGEPVTEYCDRNRLDLRARLDLFARICAAVQHAHQKGVVHRDLKPSNVLVSDGESGSEVTVIDFGIAKAVESPLTERSLFTETGILLGTPEYMSPEQAALDPLAVDTRTDVYALGILLYELLTGSLPFESSDLREAGFDEIRRRIREVSPPRPSARLESLGERGRETAERRRRPTTASLRRELAGDLDRITMKALEKEADRRYGSPAELAADVLRHLRDEPVLAQPPSVAYQLRKLVARNRLGASAVAVFLVVILGFGVWMSVLYRRSQANLDRALAAEAEVQREAETARRVSEFLVRVFEVSDPGEARGNAVTARELLDGAARRIESELAGQPEVRATLTGTMAEAYGSLGLYPRALELAEAALDLRREQHGDDHPEVGRALVARANALYQLGRLEEAGRDAGRALEVLEAALGPGNVDTAQALDTLAVLAWAGGRSRDAIPYAERALEIRERELGAGHPDHARSLNTLGNLFIATGDLDRAVGTLQTTIDIRTRVLGHDHPDTANSMNNLAETYKRMARYDDALPLYLEVLSIYETIFDDGHPELAYPHNNLGTLYWRQGKFEESERSYLEALRIREAALPPDHPLIAWTSDNLGLLYTRMGRYDDAERMILRALDIAGRAVGEDSSDYAIVVNNLAELRLAQKRFDDAEALYRRALAIHERTGGTGSSLAGDVWYNLADLFEQRGDDRAAIDAYERSLEICLDVLGEDHPDTVDTVERLEKARARLE